MRRHLCALILPAVIAVAARAGTAPDGSVYDLAQTWTNQEGRAMALHELRGPPRIVAMFFTSCQYACPRITADLKAIEKRLTAAQRKTVRFTLFSFDATGDSPATLQAFAGKNGLDSARWTLLHGGAEDVRELAAVLGINYRREADGSIAHGNAITLLDAEGAIVFQQTGLGADPAGLLDAISRICPDPRR